jgi:hypothetical protein
MHISDLTIKILRNEGCMWQMWNAYRNRPFGITRRRWGRTLKCMSMRGCGLNWRGASGRVLWSGDESSGCIKEVRYSARHTSKFLAFIHKTHNPVKCCLSVTAHPVVVDDLAEIKTNCFVPFCYSSRVRNYSVQYFKLNLHVISERQEPGQLFQICRERGEGRTESL